ncbi:MAG: NUDIX hydrolase N-terminal domain-containing protein [Caldilineaceae bacterium]|nr:NUDIX hydrolase N-terminal domain-containing protein [Caldilineaceae bacterium]
MMGTTDGRVVEAGSTEETILRVAGKLRALSNNGLHFADNPYQVETFEQMLALSAELTALVDTRPLAEIQRHFFDDTRYVSPYVVVDTAAFDDAGRILLIQRKDNGRWALPGGWCEVNELPGDGAVREVWEETGCRVELSGYLGIFDNNYHGGGGLHHLYCLLFAARHVEGTPIVTRETLDVGWFTPQNLPWDALHAAHPARIRFAFKWQEDPSQRSFYDPPSWQPQPTWQHKTPQE